MSTILYAMHDASDFYMTLHCSINSLWCYHAILLHEWMRCRFLSLSRLWVLSSDLTHPENQFFVLGYLPINENRESKIFYSKIIRQYFTAFSFATVNHTNKQTSKQTATVIALSTSTRSSTPACLTFNISMVIFVADCGSIHIKYYTALWHHSVFRINI